MLREGRRVSEIAAQVGMTRAGIYLRLQPYRRRGLLPPAPPPPVRSRPRDDELLALRQAGLRNSEIAARVGLSVSAVESRFRRLRRRGVIVPPRVPHVGDEQLLALVREGRRVTEIAAQVGRAPVSVFRRLRLLRARGLVPPRVQALRDRDRRILELRQAGLWAGQIAARLGLPARRVVERLRELHRRGLIPARRRGISDDQIIALVQQGLGGRAIAAQVGLTPAALTWRLRSLRRRGLLPHAPRSQRPTVPDQQLVALLGAGLRVVEIAKRTGFSVSTIQRRLRMLRARGAAVRPAAGRRQHATDEALVALARQGIPMQEIAARAGLGMTELYKRLRALRRQGRLPANEPAGKPATPPAGKPAEPSAEETATPAAANPCSAPPANHS